MSHMSMPMTTVLCVDGSMSRMSRQHQVGLYCSSHNLSELNSFCWCRDDCQHCAAGGQGRHSKGIYDATQCNTHCTTLYHTATHCNTLQHIATLRSWWVGAAFKRDLWCNTVQHKLHHTVLLCNTLQHSATLCNTLQHSATHCNTLQHTLQHCAAGW